MKRAIRRLLVILVMVPTISAVATPIASANDKMCPSVRIYSHNYRACMEWPL
jgi:hypothetical protein